MNKHARHQVPCNFITSATLDISRDKKGTFGGTFVAHSGTFGHIRAFSGTFGQIVANRRMGKCSVFALPRNSGRHIRRMNPTLL